VIEVSAASRADAVAWFAAHHYTGTFGGTRAFDCRVGGRRVALVAVGRGGNRFGVADKLGLTAWPGDVEITRVACAPDAPKNTASEAVAAVLRMLAAEGVSWVFTYADTAQGHVGTIYQALNGVFVGTDCRQWVNFALDGKRVAKRMVAGRFGHTRWPEVQIKAAAAGQQLERVSWMPKLLYVIPCASDARDRRAVRKALAAFSLPYPKDPLAVAPTPYRNHRPKAAA